MLIKISKARIANKIVTLQKFSNDVKEGIRTASSD